MKRLTLAMTCAVAGFAIGLTAPFATADDDKRLSVTVSFGAGLNTTGPANHHILPSVIKVKSGGVVELRRRGIPSGLRLQPRDRTQRHRRTRFGHVH